ncbi:ribonuclease HI [Pullulanibacillus pueri]|uniref:14.7 kDa ribonuclease H-like protein n=1 Tax=Pullulanibacillus pueri TaxID=1437324 RepID=A0A8J2ZV79_9BACL|nr:reverse transcriptase-like protein [Pullulanibacillus pueri]MBM7682317.1 ribonuclease HI [Pullulanibacillus pueri]GGH80818.1 14.7 kDa ribonuclease H-like protein [Pullulanibacillus pueri]
MIEVYIDGASAGNPGPSGIGILIKKTGGQSEEFSFPIEVTHNHIAEFKALITAMKLCIDRKYEMISVRTDSQLVERAVEKHHIKNKAYQNLLEEVITLEQHFQLFFIKWIPSDQNKKADLLARAGIRKALKAEDSDE